MNSTRKQNFLRSNQAFHSLVNISLFLYFQKTAQLTFPEAMICFIISIMTHLNSKVPMLLAFTLYRSLVAFNCTLLLLVFEIARQDEVDKTFRTEKPVREIASYASILMWHHTELYWWIHCRLLSQDNMQGEKWSAFRHEQVKLQNHYTLALMQEYIQEKVIAI